MTQDRQRIGLGQHLSDAASEVREQTSYINHDIGIESAECIGDDGPGPLIGHGLVHAGQTKQHGETPGETIDVSPDVLGDEGAPRRGEERGQASDGSHGVTGGEVTAKRIGLDQKHLATLRPAGGQSGGRRGHARRALDGGESDEGHLAFPR